MEGCSYCFVAVGAVKYGVGRGRGFGVGKGSYELEVLVLHGVLELMTHGELST